VEFGVDVFAAMTRNWNPFPQSLNVAAIEREFDREIEAGVEGRAAQPGSTCEWLYKSITMDAGGRIFPCCSSPRQGAELVFADFQAGRGEDVFNSGMHQQARRFFADPQAYSREPSDGQAARHPYCVKCPWEKVADPDRMHMRNYFAMAAPGVFSDPSLDLLSAW
jgi:hypothetical protein